MAFDGLVTFGISKELEHCIINGKIDKIFEPNNNEIILGIYSNGIKYALDISVSSSFYRLCLTTSSKTNPTYAPNFCMLLRKHLLNTRITKIYTLALERIVIIEFEGNNKSGDNRTKKLMIELMGKHSNIILVDDDNIIIDALKHFSIDSNSYRNILSGYKYIFPISNKLDLMAINGEDEFYNETLNYMKKSSFSEDLPLSQIVADIYTGISRTSAFNIIQVLNISDIFNKENLSKIYNYLLNLLEKTSNMILKPVLEKDYTVFLSETPKANNLQMNFFIDDYYSSKESLETFINYRNNLSKLILNYMKKLNVKLYNINQKLKECQNTDLYRLYGELITNNLYRISNSHLSKISIENYYDNNNLINIPLDPALSPALNAKKYFKKYHKLKNAKEIVETQKKEIEEKINYLESIIFEFELANTVSDIDDIYSEFSEEILGKDISNLKNQKKNKKASKKVNKSISKIGQPLKYEIDNFTVVVGKNNKQNDYITKQANENDIWLHTKDIHGSHVILKTENKIVSQDTINKCASLAAYHSKANKSSNVPVDYTYIKYVKKMPKSRPGMVIYTNYKNVIVKPNCTFED